MYLIDLPSRFLFSHTIPSAMRTRGGSTWGTRTIVTVGQTQGGILSIKEATALIESGQAAKPKGPPTRHAGLDEFRATAIAGNDLLSSCLYTAGLCARYAGPLAPVALLLVSFSEHTSTFCLRIRCPIMHSHLSPYVQCLHSFEVFTWR